MFRGTLRKAISLLCVATFIIGCMPTLGLATAPTAKISLSEYTGDSDSFSDDYKTNPAYNTYIKSTYAANQMTVNHRYSGTKTMINLSYDETEQKAFSDNNTNEYFTMKQLKDDTTNYGPTFTYNLSITGFSPNEKLHISCDMRTDDVLYAKSLLLSQKANAFAGKYNIPLVKFDTDHKIKFRGVENEPVYSLGVWYKLDLVYDFGSETDGSTATMTYYVDGQRIGVAEYPYNTIQTTSVNYFGMIGYGIHSESLASVATAREQDSVLAADNFSVKLYGADENASITPTTAFEAYKTYEGYTDIPATFTKGEEYNASLLVKDWDADKTSTLVLATYNDTELTNIAIGTEYELSNVHKLSIQTAATDTKIKVFLINNIGELVPYMSAIDVAAAE